jgi:hypothetical protein
VLVLCAAGHASALLISAQRNANGLTDRPIDLTHAVWAPPGGWWKVAVLGAVACVMLACTPLRSGADSSAAEPGGPGR